MKHVKLFEDFDDEEFDKEPEQSQEPQGDIHADFENGDANLKNAAQRRFDSTMPVLTDIMEKVADEHVAETELEVAKSTPGVEVLSNEDTFDKFIPDSIVLTPEDHPADLCYYTPDGINLSLIQMEHASGHLLKPSENWKDSDKLRSVDDKNGMFDDADTADFYDCATFMTFYKGYEKGIINIKA